MTFSPEFEEAFLMDRLKRFQHKRFLTLGENGLTRFQRIGQRLSEP